MAQITKIIYKGWDYLVAFSTPLFCVYALYDIKEIMFNKGRQERYSKTVEIGPENKKRQPLSKTKNRRSPLTLFATVSSYVLDIEKMVDNQNVSLLKSKSVRHVDEGTSTGTENEVIAKTGQCIQIGDHVPNDAINPTWTKNGKPFKSFKSSYSAQSESEGPPIESTHYGLNAFRLENISSADEGFYVCTFGEENTQMTYTVIVSGTLDTILVNNGEKIRFGKTIPYDDASSIGNWTKDGNNITSTHTKSTKFKIDMVSSEDEGLYVCRFGPDNWEKEYRLIVTRTEETLFVNSGSGRYIGKPIPDAKNAKWTKNGKDIRSRHSEPTMLMFFMQTAEDEGLYVCTFGPEKRQLKYHLIMTGLVETVIVNSGHRTTFGKTIIDENVVTNVKWSKNGKEITSTHSKPTKFRIENASFEDEGFYVCKFGTEIKIMFHLIVTGPEKTLIAKKGENCTIGLRVPHDAKNPKWTKNGGQVKSQDSGKRYDFLKQDFARGYISPVEDSLNALDLDNISLEDEGLYICTFGPESTQVKYRVIISGTEETVFAKKGDKIEFGKTLPDYDASKNAKWTKNGKQITSTHSESTKFRIDDLSPEDEGLYICVFGSKNEQSKYHVIASETEETVIGEKGDNIEIGKTITDENVSKIAQWTKNGKAIKSTHSQNTKLKIDSLSSNDEGSYACTFGKMKKQYHLIVADYKTMYSHEPMSEEENPFGIMFSSAALIAFPESDVTKLTISRKGTGLSSLDVDISSNGLTLTSVIDRPLMEFVYHSEKYNKDEYQLLNTEVYYRNSDMYIVIRMLKQFP